MPAVPSAAVADPACQYNWEVTSTVLERIHVSVGSPEGEVIAPIGHVCLRVDGEVGATFYVKESDPDEATGWAAK